MKKINLKEIASIIIHLVCIIFVIVVAFQFSGCALPDLGAFTKDSDSGEIKAIGKQITWSATQLTIQWDPPIDAVESYDVYYRAHGTFSWIPLGEVTAVANPQYTIQHSTLGNGSFDFAVVGKSDEIASNYHTSLDSTAQPSTGWFVSWQI